TATGGTGLCRLNRRLPGLLHRAFWRGALLRSVLLRRRLWLRDLLLWRRLLLRRAAARQRQGEERDCENGWAEERGLHRITFPSWRPSLRTCVAPGRPARAMPFKTPRDRRDVPSGITRVAAMIGRSAE